ncbi:E3 ubiquitin-protein ligase CBL, partial [Podarcis lilfordi]
QFESRSKCKWINRYRSGGKNWTQYSSCRITLLAHVKHTMDHLNEDCGPLGVRGAVWEPLPLNTGMEFSVALIPLGSKARQSASSLGQESEVSAATPESSATGHNGGTISPLLSLHARDLWCWFPQEKKEEAAFQKTEAQEGRGRGAWGGQEKVGGSNPRDRVSSRCSVPAPANLAVQKHKRLSHAGHMTTPTQCINSLQRLLESQMYVLNNHKRIIISHKDYYVWLIIYQKKKRKNTKVWRSGYSPCLLATQHLDQWQSPFRRDDTCMAGRLADVAFLTAQLWGDRKPQLYFHHSAQTLRSSAEGLLAVPSLRKPNVVVFYCFVGSRPEWLGKPSQMETEVIQEAEGLVRSCCVLAWHSHPAQETFTHPIPWQRTAIYPSLARHP